MLNLTPLADRRILFTLLQHAANRFTSGGMPWPQNHEYPLAFPSGSIGSFALLPISITSLALGSVGRPLPNFWNDTKIVNCSFLSPSLLRDPPEDDRETLDSH